MRSIVTKLLLLLLCTPLLGQQQQIPEDKVKNLVSDLAAKATQTGVQQQSYTYAADTGAANAYAVTLTPTPTIVAGSQVVFKATNANTGASTLAVNGGAAAAIKKNSSTALASGDIAAGQIIKVVYDGTNWQLIGSAGSNAITALTGDVTATGPGSVAATLANSGITAGTYTKVTVDAKGRTTAGTTLSTSDLPSSGATAGTYTNATVTVNAQGQVTSASNGSVGSGNYAPIQILQKATPGNGNPPLTPVFPNNTLPGSAIVVTVGYSSGSFTSVSDTQGNTFNTYASATSGIIAVALNIKGGADTVTVSGPFGSAEAYELSNVASVEGSSGASASSATSVGTGSSSTVYPFEFVLMTAFTSSTSASISNANSWPSQNTASSLFGNQADFATTIATVGSVSNTGNFTSSGNVYAGFVILRPIMSVPNPMTTTGDMIVAGASGIEQRLAAGASGKVLTGNGASTQPSWQDPAFKSLTTTGTSGAATLTGGVLNIPNYSGGGGGGLFNGLLSVPTRSGIGLTTTFNTSGSFVQADTAMGVSIYDTNASTTSQWEGLVKAYPGSAYTLTALMAPTVLGADYYCYGVVIMNTTSGKFLHFGLRWHDDTSSGHGWEVTVMAWNSPSSFNSFPTGGTTAQLAPFYTWLQVVDNGTNITFNMSTDGVIWQQVYTVSKASSFLGSSGFNYIGIGIYNGRTSGTSSLNSGMTLASWSGA